MTRSVIRFRTFSKGYGMAGLRVGYAITAPELAQAFDKVRDHFGMGRIAQAGALAALADQDWLQSRAGPPLPKARARLNGDRPRQRRLLPLPSATNFVTMDLWPRRRFCPGAPARRWPSAACSCGCRAWRHWTAACASAWAMTALDVVEEALPQALAAAG
jgi:histidinol-phosphate aminotransferase